jgi:FkbM family methyltransferase
MTDLKVVKKGADYFWLRKQAKNKQTLKELAAIQRAEDRIYEGVFSNDTSHFLLKLGKYSYWFRRSDAYYSIQIYTEIFKENDHFLLDYFLPKDAPVVIDLGAHLGFYAFKLKQMYPKSRVIAVEADPSMFHLLQKNIKTNKLRNIEVVNKAIAATNEDTPFFFSIHAGVLGGKYLKTLKRDLRPYVRDKMIKKTKVPGITLKELMKQHKLEYVDLIKLDIEDMEYEVLKGSEKEIEKIKAIVMQWHNPKTRDQVVELLKKHGFGVSYYEPRDYGDIYFINSRFTRL